MSNVAIGLKAHKQVKLSKSVRDQALVRRGVLDLAIPCGIGLWKRVAKPLDAANKLPRGVLTANEEDSAVDQLHEDAKLLVFTSDEAEQVAKGATAGDNVDLSCKVRARSQAGDDGGLDGMFGVVCGIGIAKILAVVLPQLARLGERRPFGRFPWILSVQALSSGGTITEIFARGSDIPGTTIVGSALSSQL